MTPDYKTDLVTKSESVTDPSSGIINGDDLGGTLLKATATATLTGSESADQTIKVTPNLPADVVVEADLCSVSCDNPGTALVIDVGDEDDADRYADGITLSAGGKIAFTGGAAAITPHRPSAAQSLFATLKTVTAPTAGAKLTFHIVYRGKA